MPDSETQLVRMGNLYGNKLDLDRSPVFYPDTYSKEYQKYVLSEGDIIMSLTGTTGKEDYGYAVRIPDCSHALLMNQRIAKFDPISRLLKIAPMPSASFPWNGILDPFKPPIRTGNPV